MLRTEKENKFRKDLKKCMKRGYDHDKIREIVDILASEQILPIRCKPHKLKGEYNGYWECHIEPDWLLVYEYDGDILRLIRTGTHSDLFD